MLTAENTAAIKHAGMAELADALDSGSNGRKAVQVQVLLPAPSSLKPIVNAEFERFFLSVKFCFSEIPTLKAGAFVFWI